MTIYLPLWALWFLVPLALALVFELLWVHYLAVMHLKRVLIAKELVGESLKPFSRWFGFNVVLPIGLVLDWVGNVLCTFIFLDLPAAWGELITGRLQRYVNAGLNKWRGAWAWWFADDALNDYDPDPRGHVQPYGATK